MNTYERISLDLKIGHRNWEEALASAFSLLISASPGDVVCVTGPSRAGKTRLIQELRQLLIGDHRFDTTGTLPVVVVEAANTGPNGAFSTKSFTLRMLEAVQHALLAVGDSLGGEREFALQKLERTTETTLRVALEKGLQARRTQYLFIDEAQHARYVSKHAVGSYAVMDSWKCLAQTAGIVLVVVGAYPILQIIRHSPHLIGRKFQVHLPRYQYTRDDLREFAVIVAQYERKLAVCDSVGGLLRHVELLWGGTLGCIGLLRAWLFSAAARASVQGVPITHDILLKARLSDDDLREIGAEITEGERLLANSAGGDVATLSTNVGSTPKAAVPTTKKRALKPFQKKPVRRRPGHRSEGAI